MKIGIPEGLFFYKYYPLWESFFNDLNAELVLSGVSNKKVLVLGSSLCVDEACLPVKIYHGHVDIIKDKVDAIFIPRIMSIKKHEYICPKFCGLPEMIKSSVSGIPEIIDITINLRNSERSIYNSVLQAGKYLTNDRKRIMNAFKNGLIKQREFEKLLKKSGDFEGALRGYDKPIEPKSLKIALLGHPYILYDSFLNMDVFAKLHSMGCEIITPQMVDDETIDRNADILGKRHFWTTGREILGTGLSCYSGKTVDGIIYLSSFCCGIDSIIEDFLKRRISKDGHMPYMMLVLDEHSGEAGFNTRLEAFLDMIKWRKSYENNIPAHGRNIYCS